MLNKYFIFVLKTRIFTFLFSWTFFIIFNNVITVFQFVSQLKYILIQHHLGKFSYVIQ